MRSLQYLTSSAAVLQGCDRSFSFGKRELSKDFRLHCYQPVKTFLKITGAVLAYAAAGGPCCFCGCLGVLIGYDVNLFNARCHVGAIGAYPWHGGAVLVCRSRQ